MLSQPVGRRRAVSMTCGLPQGKRAIRCAAPLIAPSPSVSRFARLLRRSPITTSPAALRMISGFTSRYTTSCSSARDIASSVLSADARHRAPRRPRMALAIPDIVANCCGVLGHAFSAADDPAQDRRERYATRCASASTCAVDRGASVASDSTSTRRWRSASSSSVKSRNHVSVIRSGSNSTIRRHRCCRSPRNAAPNRRARARAHRSDRSGASGSPVARRAPDRGQAARPA